jgi:hypothetical protein
MGDPFYDLLMGNQQQATPYNPIADMFSGASAPQQPYNPLADMFGIKDTPGKPYNPIADMFGQKEDPREKLMDQLDPIEGSASNAEVMKSMGTYGMGDPETIDTDTHIFSGATLNPLKWFDDENWRLSDKIKSGVVSMIGRPLVQADAWVADVLPTWAGGSEAKAEDLWELADAMAFRARELAPDREGGAGVTELWEGGHKMAALNAGLETFTESVPLMAVGMLTGGMSSWLKGGLTLKAALAGAGATTATVFGGVEASGLYQEGREAGVGKLEATATSATAGALVGLAETYATKGLFKSLGTSTVADSVFGRKLAAPLIRNLVGRPAKMISVGGREAWTEAVQEVLNIGAQSSMDLDTGNIRHRLIDAAAAGFLGAEGMHYSSAAAGATYDVADVVQSSVRSIASPEHSMLDFSGVDVAAGQALDEEASIRNMRQFSREVGDAATDTMTAIDEMNRAIKEAAESPAWSVPMVESFNEGRLEIAGHVFSDATAEAVRSTGDRAVEQLTSTQLAEAFPNADPELVAAGNVEAIVNDLVQQKTMELQQGLGQVEIPLHTVEEFRNQVRDVADMIKEGNINKVYLLNSTIEGTDMDAKDQYQLIHEMTGASWAARMVREIERGQMFRKVAELEGPPSPAAEAPGPTPSNPMEAFDRLEGEEKLRYYIYHMSNVSEGYAALYSPSNPDWKANTDRAVSIVKDRLAKMAGTTLDERLSTLTLSHANLSGADAAIDAALKRELANTGIPDINAARKDELAKNIDGHDNVTRSIHVIAPDGTVTSLKPGDKTTVRPGRNVYAREYTDGRVIIEGGRMPTNSQQESLSKLEGKALERGQPGGAAAAIDENGRPHFETEHDIELRKINAQRKREGKPPLEYTGATGDVQFQLDEAIRNKLWSERTEEEKREALDDVASELSEIKEREAIADSRLRQDTRIVGKNGKEYTARFVMDDISVRETHLFDENGDNIGQLEWLRAVDEKGRWSVGVISINPEHRRLGLAERMIVDAWEREGRRPRAEVPGVQSEEGEALYNYMFKKYPEMWGLGEELSESVSPNAEAHYNYLQRRVKEEIDTQVAFSQQEMIDDYTEEKVAWLSEYLMRPLNEVYMRVVLLKFYETFPAVTLNPEPQGSAASSLDNLNNLYVFVKLIDSLPASHGGQIVGRGVIPRLWNEIQSQIESSRENVIGKPFGENNEPPISLQQDEAVISGYEPGQQSLSLEELLVDRPEIWNAALMEVARDQGGWDGVNPSEGAEWIEIGEVVPSQSRSGDISRPHLTQPLAELQRKNILGPVVEKTIEIAKKWGISLNAQDLISIRLKEHETNNGFDKIYAVKNVPENRYDRPQPGLTKTQNRIYFQLARGRGFAHGKAVDVMSMFMAKDAAKVVEETGRAIGDDPQGGFQPVTEADIEAVRDRIYENTQDFLKRRGLPEKFRVFRAGPVEGKYLVPVSLNANLSSHFTSKHSGTVRQYEVDRRDIQVAAFMMENWPESEVRVMGVNLKPVNPDTPLPPPIVFQREAVNTSLSAAKKAVKGAYLEGFGSNGNDVIELMGNATPDTLIHELTHAFLDRVSDPQVREDLEGLAKALSKDLKKPMREVLPTLFEKMFKGDYDNDRLSGDEATQQAQLEAFHNFFSWAHDTYSKVRFNGHPIDKKTAAKYDVLLLGMAPAEVQAILSGQEMGAPSNIARRKKRITKIDRLIDIIRDSELLAKYLFTHQAKLEVAKEKARLEGDRELYDQIDALLTVTEFERASGDIVSGPITSQPNLWDPTIQDYRYSGHSLVKILHDLHNGQDKDVTVKERHLLDQFMEAQRNVELWEREGKGEDLVVDHIVGKRAMTWIDRFRAGAEGVSAERASQIERTADRIRDWMYRSTIQPLVAAGVFTSKQVEDMREKNKFYATFHRLFEEDLAREPGEGEPDTDWTSFHKQSWHANPIRKIHGDSFMKDAIDSPLQSMVHKMWQARRFANHQNIQNAMVALLEGAPQIFGAEEFEKVVPKEKGGRPTEKAGFSVITGYKIAVDPISGVEKRVSSHYRVSETLAKLINAHGSSGMNAKQMNVLARTAANMAMLTRMGATLSFSFIARNPFRDQFAAGAFSKYGYIPFWDALKGLGARSVGSWQARAMAEEGGQSLIGSILGKKLSQKYADKYEEYITSGASHADFLSMDMYEAGVKLDDVYNFFAGEEGGLTFKNWLTGKHLKKLRRFKNEERITTLDMMLDGIIPLKSMSAVMEEGTRIGAFMRARGGGSILEGKPSSIISMTRKMIPKIRIDNKNVQIYVDEQGGVKEKKAATHWKDIMTGNVAVSVESFQKWYDRTNRLTRTEKEGGGATVAEAAHEARDITLDFGRGGEFTSWWNRYEAFFNANFLDVDRTFRGLNERPFEFFFKSALFIVAPTMIMWAMRRDDEEYKDQPKWRKLMFFHPYKRKDAEGNGNGYFVLPRPHGLLNAIFSAGLEQAFDLMATGDKDYAEQLIYTMVESTPWSFILDYEGAGEGWSNTFTGTGALEALPNIVQPPIELIANKAALTGAPITPRREEGLGPLIGQNLGPTERFVSSATGGILNPYQVRHIIRGYGSTVARQGVELFMNKPIAAATGQALETQAQPPPFWDVLGMHSRRPIGFGSKPLNDLFTWHASVQDLNKQIKAWRGSKNPNRFAEIARIKSDHPEIVRSKSLNNTIAYVRKQATLYRKYKEMGALGELPMELVAEKLREIDERVTIRAGLDLDMIDKLTGRNAWGWSRFKGPMADEQ